MSSKRFKAVVMMLAILALGSILLAACVRPGTTTTTSTGGGSTATSTPAAGEAEVVVTVQMEPCKPVCQLLCSHA